MTLFALGASRTINEDAIQMSPRYNGSKFVNEKPALDYSAHTFGAMVKEYMFVKHPRTTPKSAIPVMELTNEALESLPADKTIVYRLGHSTLLLWMNNEFWLTDPVFSKRASPFQFTGPKRFHEPPISIEQLPKIKGVILSHNHYDHLDKGSIKQLLGKVENYIVPLGVGSDLVKWGVAEENITELDWWEHVTKSGVKFTATPAQHFSGRSIGDGDKTLWSSWSIEGADQKIFFSGDSGYFSGFKEIGDKLGPFDMAFMETGAYNKLWIGVHMMPEETLQAFKDVQGSVLVPVHNGTFSLSLHPWDDPFIKINNLAKQNNVRLLTPVMGQQIDLQNLPEQMEWWVGLE